MENEGYETIDLLEVLNAVRQHLLARRVGGQTVEHRGTGTVAGCGGVEVPWVLGQSCIAGALRAQLGDYHPAI